MAERIARQCGPVDGDAVDRPPFLRPQIEQRDGDARKLTLQGRTECIESAVAPNRRERRIRLRRIADDDCAASVELPSGPPRDRGASPSGS
jgi:hypothetical protein